MKYSYSKCCWNWIYCWQIRDERLSRLQILLQGEIFTVWQFLSCENFSDVPLWRHTTTAPKSPKIHKIRNLIRTRPKLAYATVTNRKIQLTTFDPKTSPTGGSNWPFRCLDLEEKREDRGANFSYLGPSLVFLVSCAEALSLVWQPGKPSAADLHRQWPSGELRDFRLFSLVWGVEGL